MTVMLDDKVHQEEWVPISKAVKALGMNWHMFNRRMLKYKFEVRTSARDERLKYVNLVEIRERLHFT